MTDYLEYHDQQTAREDEQLIDALAVRAQTRKWSRERLFEVLVFCGTANEIAMRAAEHARPASSAPKGPWARE